MVRRSKIPIRSQKLNKEAIQQVTDILVEPPTSGKYDALKTRLLEVYEESELRKNQKLIGEMELVDQKPSQLWRRMTELARDKIKNEAIRILWQNHLPSSVRGILTVSAIQDASKLAAMADKIMEKANPTHTVAAKYI